MLFPQHMLLGAVTSSASLTLSLSSKDTAIWNSRLEDSMLLIQVTKLEGLFQQRSMRMRFNTFRFRLGSGKRSKTIPGGKEMLLLTRDLAHTAADVRDAIVLRVSLWRSLR